MTLTSLAQLPDYTPSQPAPNYSSSPLPGEKCIQRGPLQVSQSFRDTTYTYEGNDVTMTLRGCREEDGAPSFDLCGTVNGECSLTGRANITSVLVKLEGHILVKESPAISSTMLFSKRHTVWETSGETICPGVLPLSISFPSHYRENQTDRNLPLPPSVLITRPRHAVVVYTLSVIVRKKTNFLFCMKTTREVSTIAHLRYSPRLRLPLFARLASPEFKHDRDRWREHVWSINTQSLQADSTCTTAWCRFFLPPVQVFQASDIIPFRLSFCGSAPFVKSLVKFLGLPADEEEYCHDIIHVFLVRQTNLYTERTKSTYEEITGRGSLLVDQSVMAHAPCPVGTRCLSWTGELRCQTPVAFTSFTTSTLEVRDYVILSFVSPDSLIKPKNGNLYRSIPIRIVAATE